jgi:hypothetical protein
MTGAQGILLAALRKRDAHLAWRANSRAAAEAAWTAAQDLVAAGAYELDRISVVTDAIATLPARSDVDAARKAIDAAIAQETDHTPESPDRRRYGGDSTQLGDEQPALEQACDYDEYDVAVKLAHRLTAETGLDVPAAFIEALGHGLTAMTTVWRCTTSASRRHTPPDPLRYLRGTHCNHTPRLTKAIAERWPELPPVVATAVTRILVGTEGLDARASGLLGTSSLAKVHCTGAHLATPVARVHGAWLARAAAALSGNALTPAAAKAVERAVTRHRAQMAPRIADGPAAADHTLGIAI